MVLLPKKPMKEDIMMKELVGLHRPKLIMVLIIKKQKLLGILTDGDLKIKEDINKFKNGELVEPKKTHSVLSRSSHTSKMEKIFKRWN